MEEVAKSETLGWKEFILALGMIIAIPVVIFIGLNGFTEYKRNLKYAELFAQMDIDQFESFNKLCSTFIDLSLEQKWDDTVEQWSELCLRRNKEFFEKYAR